MSMLREDEYLAIYTYLIHSSHVVEVDAEHSFCLKWVILGLGDGFYVQVRGILVWNLCPFMESAVQLTTLLPSG